MPSVPTIGETYGAMLIGLIIATFLQGVLTVQIYHYFTNYSKDPLLLKALVAVAWSLDAIHLIFISHPTYYFLVSNWGNPAVLSTSTVLLNLHLPLIALTTLLCQFYFLHRVWVFTDKNISIMAILLILSLSSFAFALFITVKILEDLSVATFYRYRFESIPQFILAAASDVGIAGILCYFLDKGKGECRSTDNVISRLVRNTVATGLATSVLAVACTITYLAEPQTLIFVSMHFSMGRMYTNALLATLNTRKTYGSYLDAVVSQNRSRTRSRSGFPTQVTTFAACAPGETVLNIISSKHSAVESHEAE